MKKTLASTATILAMVSMTIAAYGGSLPVIINVTVTGITSTSATINWLTTSAADSQVAYGTTLSYGSLTALDPTLVTSHSQTLTGLTPNTTIHYQVRSKISSGIQYLAGDFVFTTAPNIVSGMISGLTVTSITNSSATFTWTTNVPASSVIEYGPTSSYLLSAGTADLVTSHSVVVSGLAANTLYHFRAKSIDASGNAGITADAIFTTTSLDVTPTITRVSASFVTSTTAAITWFTDVPADSLVFYGLTPGLGSSTLLDTTLTTSHAQTLAGLTPSTTYIYEVQSTNPGADPAASNLYYFTTPAASLFIPEITLAPGESTGVAFANLDPGSATLNLTAFDGSGASIQGIGVTNPASVPLGPGAQLAATMDMLFGPITANWPVGWAAANSSTAKLAGFFLTFDNALSLLDGADLPSVLLNSFVLPHVGSQDYTRIMLANGSSSVASLNIDLVKTDGTVRSSLQTNIAGFATYAADLKSEMFPGVATDPSDYVRVSSSAGLLPFEFFGNMGKDAAVVAGQDLNGGATTLYSPVYVVGGNISSVLSIVNLDPLPGTVTLVFKGDDGSQIGAAQAVPIPANGKIYVADPAYFLGSAPSQSYSGYVQVTSSGVRLSGSVSFSDAIQGVFSTALPLVSTLQQELVLSHVASDDTFFTGLAIVNPNTVDATVHIQVYTASGQPDQSTTLSVPAGHGISRVLTELFPALAGQSRTSGYVRISSDQGIACFGVFGTNTLSVLSAIPAQFVR